jgi:hypothetical protein
MKKDNTTSILVISTGFLILSIIFFKHPKVSAILLTISIASGITHLVSPTLSNYIVIGWNKLAHVLGWINTRILLTLVYYLFLFPISIFYKFSNKNPLQRKNPDRTLFIERNHQYCKKDLENIW